MPPENDAMDWIEIRSPRPMARVEIDVGAAQRNLRAVTERAGRPALCVVKADAYGHGADRIAVALEHEPACRGFAVARLEEAEALRPVLSTGLPIVCFGTFLAARDRAERREVLSSCHELGIEPVLASARDVNALLELPAREWRALRLHVAVDTGMTREGMGLHQLPEAQSALVRAGARAPAIWTHFASSEEPSGPAVAAQLDAFTRVLDGLEGGAGDLHLENSAAALHGLGARLPEALSRRIVYTRVGGALYGLDLRTDGEDPRLEPVMQVRTRLVQVRRIDRGTAVGYGASWVAPRESVIGLAAIGYADGLRSPAPDLLWHGAEHSARVPVVGRISMDLITVDCTEIAAAGVGPEVGDELVVLGRSRDHVVDARAHAQAAGVVDYAVTVGFSLRLPRWPDASEPPPPAPGSLGL